MRDTYDRRTFHFDNLPGFPWGRRATRWVLHTDGNPNPHTALNALKWGNRERAFNIHLYVHDEVAYWAVPLNWQAFHVLASSLAAAADYPTTLPGLSKPRGDIYANGSEHVMLADGTWTQATRITSLLAHAEAFRANPALLAAISEHATWDQVTRRHDVGEAVWIPDWVLDVKDLIADRVPWRTVGDPYVAEPATGGPDLVDQPPIDPDGDLRQQMAEVADWSRLNTHRIIQNEDHIEAAVDRMAAHVAWHATTP